jgi:hypothetical protein
MYHVAPPTNVEPWAESWSDSLIVYGVITVVLLLLLWLLVRLVKTVLERHA